MMEYNIKKLKKQIIYRCSYTGTKECDLLYQKLIITSFFIVKKTAVKKQPSTKLP